MAGPGRFVDINRATTEELESLSGVGRTIAKSIVEVRTALGGFSSIEDLKVIQGIGKIFFDVNKNGLCCTPTSSVTRRETRGSAKAKTGRPSLNRRCSPPRTSSKGQSTPKGNGGESAKRKLSCSSSHQFDDEESEKTSPEKKFCTPAHKRLLKLLPLRNYGTIKTATPLMSPVDSRRRHMSFCGHSPAGLDEWLRTFHQWSVEERKYALDEIIETCEPAIVRHIMGTIEPRFQRDFISLLPRELALYVLSFLEPKDLLRAAQTCKCWQTLCDDNLLWKQKCKQARIEEEPLNPVKCVRRRSNGSQQVNQTTKALNSPFKKLFMTKQRIYWNWRMGPLRPSKVLKGHDDHVITCLQFCGSRIVSGSDDGTLKVWSALSGKCLRTLVGHTGGVWSSQLSGNVIVSGSTDRTLKVWNADTGQCMHTLYGHSSTVRCMDMHDNTVVSGSRDGTLRVWDTSSGNCLHVLVGHLAAVRCVKYDGRRVVSGAYDFLVKVWDPETEQCIHTLQGHTNRVYSLQFDGVYIVSGSLDTSIRVWHVETGQCLHTLIGHQSLTSGMELKNNTLVSGNADSTVKIWDITSGQCLQTLAGPNKHQSAVTCLQFNSRFVITSSDDGTVKIWDLHTGEFIRDLVKLDSGGSGGVVWRVKCDEKKLVCAVGSRNGTEETKLLVLDFDVHD